MSMTLPESTTGKTATYGGFADAAGGIATIVLGVVGLAFSANEWLAAVATIVFGAALLVQAGAMLSEYATIMFPARSAGAGGMQGSSLPAVFVAGAAGIILGILALVGLHPNILIGSAVIAFGTALILGANAAWHLNQLKRVAAESAARARTESRGEIVANEMDLGSAATQAVGGLAAIVLGILALAGGAANSSVLNLVAFIVLGGAIVVAGTAVSATALSFISPEARSSETKPSERPFTSHGPLTSPGE